MKSVCIRSYSGPYFPSLGLNTDQNNSKYGHFSHNVMLGPLSISTSKSYQSYFLLPSEILRLAPALKDMEVFGCDSEANVFKPFVDLFSSATFIM